MSSFIIRELEHLIIHVVILLCLVTVWTLGGTRRRCFNRRIRVWFTGGCCSLWNSVQFCLCYWNNLSTRHSDATRGDACWQWQKMFVMRVHSYRACTASWYCARVHLRSDPGVCLAGPAPGAARRITRRAPCCSSIWIRSQRLLCPVNASLLRICSGLVFVFWQILSKKHWFLLVFLKCISHCISPPKWNAIKQTVSEAPAWGFSNWSTHDLYDIRRK